jgi:lysophospholipase L1-like esterase
VKLSEIDGVHLDEEGHRVLADLLANKIREILD